MPCLPGEQVAKSPSKRGPSVGRGHSPHLQEPLQSSRRVWGTPQRRPRAPPSLSLHLRLLSKEHVKKWAKPKHTEERTAAPPPHSLPLLRGSARAPRPLPLWAPSNVCAYVCARVPVPVCECTCVFV